MRHVTLGAFVTGEVLAGVDLFMLGRAGRIGFVTPEAVTMCQQRQLHIEIVHVLLARAMTHFAGERLVAKFGQFLALLLVTSNAGFLARIRARQTGSFH